MEVLNSLLLWVHLAALGVVGAAVFGIPILAAKMASVDGPGKEALGKGMMALSKAGASALGTMIVVGLIMIWTAFEGPANMPWIFWVKMLLVVVAIGNIILGRRNAMKAMSGDAAAAARQPKFAMAGIALVLAIVLCAVVAFR